MTGILAANRNILVIGATGHFGGRICRRLTQIPDIHLVLASRAIERADTLAKTLLADGPSASISTVELDQSSQSLQESLRAVEPLIVVHTAGPYQGQDYRVANACIDQGCHYVDLADGSDFVMNFSSLDEAARRRNVLLVTGASTLPALSGAVIDELRADFSELEGIDISIAPGHRTPRGGGTVAAVLSYCGRPFQTLENGQWRTVHGWQGWRLLHYPHMRRRIGGVCDVPDLRLLPSLYPQLRTVSFHAALEASWEQLALWLMAALTRLRIVDDWSRFASSFRSLGARFIRLGSETGAMHVRLCGTDRNGARLQRTWFVTARNNYGPEIPCTPAIVIVKKLLGQQLDERGAIGCHRLMSLDEFEHEVSIFDFEYDIVDEGNAR